MSVGRARSIVVCRRAPHTGSDRARPQICLAPTPICIDASLNRTPWASNSSRAARFAWRELPFRLATIPLSLKSCTGGPAIWTGAAGAHSRQ